MEITFHISWRRSFRGVRCSTATIASGNLIGYGQLDCQYGCPSRVRISSMQYRCTDFSEAEDWSYGERRLAYNFTGTAPITIGFSGTAWISPFNSHWNLSTTFSMARRNDTGRINSTPRAKTSPVIYVQEGCNHTISIAVSDPDDDTVRCRWAQGVECGGICSRFPGAELNPETCRIEYQANRGTGFQAAALMIEDFSPNSISPLSSVALQFLVLVVRSNEPCSSKPEFIPPTISQGVCIAIPPSTTFNTTLVATSGGSDFSIREIQTVSPIGLEKGELYRVEESSSYYVTITWTPTASQQNETHLFCYSALNSAGLSSGQTCIEFFPGEFPPNPVQATATPNGQLVHPSNTTWHIQFDTEIQRPAVVAYISFHERDTNREIYKIDTSSSSEVTFIRPNEISITPRYFFAEETNYYINFERGVVRGTTGCKPGNEPLTDKNFWTFETRDVTPAVLWFITRPPLSNANVTFSWVSNEVVTWACMLIEGATVLEVNCSEAYWRGIDLTEGTYTLQIEATDEGGNMAHLSHTFEVDLTPPTTSILYKPASVSNQQRAFFRFRCNELCSLECQFVAGGVSDIEPGYFPCNSGRFTTVTLQHDSNYTFSVRGTDQVGNKGEAVMYMWETDFVKPSLFGVRNLSIPCTNNTSPDHTGQAQATDNREEMPSVTYRDLNTNCFIKRTWSATDIASNTAYLIQHITLDFSPSISLLPMLSYQCDSALINPVQVPAITASSPNPCRRPLQITYENSIDSYICPGTFNRTWTVVDTCNRKNTSSSQTISLYDACPPYACGRNETPPHGVCTFGTCQCNSPWFGDDCNTVIYEPQVEPVNDVVLQEAEDYTENVILTQGTPPLSLSLLLGPDRLAIDQLSGQITWRRAQAGNYTVSVQAENRAGRATLTWSLCVKSGYNASLDIVSPNTYSGAQPVQLTGRVEYKAGNVIKNLLASVVPVSIDITSEQTTRLLKTFTSRDGTFSTVFYPARTEYGTYIARARHPSSVFQSIVQTQWQFLGMKASPRLIQLNGETIGNYQNTFYNATKVTNDGPAALHNLRAIPVLGNIVGLHVNIQLNGTSSVSILQPSDSVLMNINIETTGAFDAVFPIRLETTEGTTLYLSVNLRIAQILPSFVVSPPSVNSRIIRGNSNIFQFNVTNVGRIDATSVRVLLPATNFISFISFGTQQQAEGNLTLGSRESALLSILVQTQSNQQLGDISGNLIISSTETSKRVPFTFTVSSNVQMNFTVRVEDEYTYFAEGQPLVSNAVVRLVNHQRNIRLTVSTEEDNGTATFINIPEDRYELVVEAPNHQSINQIVITSIDTPVLTVFIQRQAVTYTWSVSQTTFEDTYTITLEADFETHVPQPVVTVTPTEIELEELELGLVDTLQFNITNHGLIRAENLEFELPNGHPFLKFTTNANNLGSVEPLSSIIVPVQVSRKTREKRAYIWVIYAINIVYSYVCGDLQFQRIPVLMKKRVYRPDEAITDINWPQCSAGCGGGGVGGGGGGSGVPGFSFSGFSASTPAFCNKCLQTVWGCINIAIPSPRFSFAGCAPLIAAGSFPNFNGDIISGIITIWDWLNCLFELPWPSTIANCVTKFYTNCLEPGSSGNRRRRSVTSMVNALAEAMYPIHLSIDLGIEVLGDKLWITVEDPNWLSNVLRPTVADESDSGVLISKTELSTILSAPLPNGTTIEAVTRMVERMNNTLFGWNNGQLEPQNTSFNMASYSTVQQLTQDINLYQQKAQEKGFSSYLEAYNFAANELNQLDSWEDEAGVCAVVRIRVEQELALTREAFLAKLEIENNEASSLEKVTVEIVITDTTTAEEATGRFSIGNSTLSGSLNSDLSLPSGMSGSAEWLIVPYSEAAPTSNRIYDVGGVLSYTLNGEEIVIPLLPTKITVIPDPSLLVHYFWEKYVVGDDPFTDEREPSVPFTLGVAVKNSGYGTAHNLHITSAQPEIIENERGLLVTFRIIGANVGKESTSPSLTVNFDDITPNTTKVARWYMVSSLQGEFKNYSATFENVNPLGDPKLSILDDLKIHELIRNVLIYIGEENDQILDFLVNDRNDLSAYPDGLYSSKTLQQHNVTTGEVQSVENREPMSVVVLAASNSSGWTYFRYEDTQGLFTSTALAVNFTRNDTDRSIPLPPENCWITKNEQNPRNNGTNIAPFYLHILDYIHNSECVVYTLNLCTADCHTEERSYNPIITVTAQRNVATATVPTRDSTAAPTDVTATPTFDITATPNLDITATLDITTTSTLDVTVTPNLDITATPNLDVTATLDITTTSTLDVTVTPNLDITATPNLDITATPNLDITATPNLDVTATPGLIPLQQPQNLISPQQPQNLISPQHQPLMASQRHLWMSPLFDITTIAPTIVMTPTPVTATPMPTGKYFHVNVLVLNGIIISRLGCKKIVILTEIALRCLHNLHSTFTFHLMQFWSFIVRGKWLETN